MNGKQSPHMRSKAGVAPAVTDDVEQEASAGSDGPESLTRQLRELTEYLLHYVRAKSDGVKLSVRRAAFLVGLSALGFVAISGLIVAASWCMISGGAEGLAVLLGNRMWAGNMVAGFVVLAGLCFAIGGLTAKRRRITRERTARKYEDRQARQQAEFGHNACERAANGVRKKK